jgi:hypothetical protein
MAREQAITVAFALICLAAAAVWWVGSGGAARSHPLFHAKAPASAAAPHAPATVAVGTGVLGIAARQNLAASVSGADARAAAALQSTR